MDRCKVRERPRVQASHAISELDTVDMGAIHTALEWGWIGRQEVVYFRVRPLPVAGLPVAQCSASAARLHCLALL